ncbi:fimbrial protein [Serratia marcescens]|nr:fimbrial protein [Serratia marcescens]
MNSMGVGVLLMLLSGVSVQATANMQFSGALITPPLCTLNGGQQIDVNFGDRVGVRKVDGVNYRQTVDYQLQCEPGASGVALGLTLTGPQALFDTATLQTNRPGLGIRMTLDGQPFELATRVVIDAGHPPVLQAVPVKAPDATLEEGAFEVLATLLADYQ